MKTYDVMFIFPSLITDEGLEASLESIRKELERLGGTIERLERLGRRTFARPIAKREDGLYVRLWMQLDPEQSSAFLQRLKLNEDIVRVQVRRLDAGMPVTPPAAVPVAAPVTEDIDDGQS